jgi:hypothetical protein
VDGFASKAGARTDHRPWRARVAAAGGDGGLCHGLLVIIDLRPPLVQDRGNLEGSWREALHTPWALARPGVKNSRSQTLTPGGGWWSDGKCHLDVPG